MVTLQNVIESTQLEHGMIHGDKYDALRRDTFLQKRVDHLILDRGFSDPPGAGEDHGPPEVRLFQPLHCFIIGKPAVGLCKIRVDHPGDPPGIKRLQDFENLFFCCNSHIDHLGKRILHFFQLVNK